MRIALINPAWSFANSVYFGCPEPHLPLELAYSQALLQQRGHEAVLLDAHLEQTTPSAVAEAVSAFRADVVVITTAPTYLFWRCAQPELRAAIEMTEAVRGSGARIVAVGPHGSASPDAVLRKLHCDAVVVGECEETVSLLDQNWAELEHLALPGGNRAVPKASVNLAALPSLRWPDHSIARHAHHHHRFDSVPAGPGAEVEVSRGCPYRCTFCAKLDFRDQYRRRPLEPVLAEIDCLMQQGVRYFYFIDELFLPWVELLEALASRAIQFGIQTRIDLWSERLLDLLGRAGCVSIEAGVDSVTEQGRASLEKGCRATTEDLAARLLYAKRRVPFVQANLLATAFDSAEELTRFRTTIREGGVWANDPVPLFPYPGSPEYRRRWGAPDDSAWERAHNAYLTENAVLSDLQSRTTMSLVQLEAVRD